MSQIVRDSLVEDLCQQASMDRKKVLAMSDAEVEYYHWLYLEESVYDLM